MIFDIFILCFSQRYALLRHAIRHVHFCNRLIEMSKKVNFQISALRFNKEKMSNLPVFILIESILRINLLIVTVSFNNGVVIYFEFLRLSFDKRNVKDVAPPAPIIEALRHFYHCTLAISNHNIWCNELNKNKT